MNVQTSIIIFMGPPGAGKGSLSQLCVERRNWAQLSTGALCRKHIAEKSDIGREIDFLIKSGKLISDDLIVSMVQTWMSEHIGKKEGIILDGFPRTVEQARLFSEVFQERLENCKLHVVKLNISEQAVMDRLQQRFVCENIHCQMVYSMQQDSSCSPKNGSACDKCSGVLRRRDDDILGVVSSRLKTYYAFEKLLENYFYEQDHSVSLINADRPIAHVYSDFEKIIGI